MLNHSINYTGDVQQMGGSVTTPLQAAHAIMNGYIPDNFISYSNRSDAFRDATLADLIVIGNHLGKMEEIINTLAHCMRSSQDNSLPLRVFSEYLATIAIAWERHELAGRVLMRNTPESITPYLWSIFSGVKNNIPSSTFTTLIVQNGGNALTTWTKEAVEHFGLDPSTQGIQPTQTTAVPTV